MNAKYVQRGEALDYRNDTEQTILNGSVVTLETRIGIAGCDITPGMVGAIHVIGVFEMPKKAGEAVEMGEDVFFSETDGITVNGEGTVPAGYAIAPAAESDSTVMVKLMG